jgi:exopolysaccharide biosynthesis operon protein EpsL
MRLRTVPKNIMLLSLAMSGASSALAQTDDVLRPYVATAFSFDDNVLGLPGPEVAALLTGSRKMTDVSHSNQAGLKLQKMLGRQFILADIGASDIRYERYSQLNYQGRNLTAEWRWVLGSHLEGKIATSYIRSLTPFDDFLSIERRLRTERRQDTEFRYRFHPRWRIRGAVGAYDTEYETAGFTSGTRDEVAREAGLDFVTPEGNFVGLSARRLSGANPAPLSAGGAILRSGFKQEDIRLRVDWRAGGKTRVTFAGGPLSRSYQSLGTKDFRGINARLNLDWSITGKSSISGAAWREVSNVDDLSIAYALSKGVSLGPRWSISSKLDTDLQLRLEIRDFRASQVFAQAAGYGDTLRSAIWSVNYAYDPHWVVRMSTFRTLKEARGRSSDFGRNGANVSLRYEF